MNYKFEKGSVVVLRDRLYLGEAKVVGYRNSTYVLEFANDHPELADVRYPFTGGREFRGLHAAEHQIESMVTHDPEMQTWKDPQEAHHADCGWHLRRFMKQE